MLRKAGFLLLLGLLAGSPCFGQEWARKMFKDPEHDFGTVAKGAKAEFEFVLRKHLFGRHSHRRERILAVAAPAFGFENPLVKTYEKGAVVAHFNTGTFSGQRGATLTITIDKPFYAEVQPACSRQYPLTTWS